MKYKESPGSRVFDIVNVIFCFFIGLICLYPFIYVFSMSISGYKEIATGQIYLYPKGFSLDVYKYVFADPQILRSYLNSILYTATYTIIVLVLCSMGGFVLAEDRFLYKRSVTLFFAAMMFFSGGLIPTFLWIRAIKLVNTMWAIVLPTAVSPFYIIIFRTSIRATVHQSLKDSVYIDGGSDFLIYTRIVIPLIKPILATIGLFAAVSMWNEFFRPMVYLYDSAKMPLTILLRRVLIQRDFGGNLNLVIPGADDVMADYIQSGWLGAMKNAIIIVTVTPILLVYPFIQRYFVKGIMIGAIKE